MRWSDVVFSLGSPTDGFGRLEMDSVATGEYALAWRTSPVAITERNIHEPIIVGPNPADDYLVVDLGTIDAGLDDPIEVYMSASQFEYWKYTHLTIDVVPGRGAGFSVEGPTGLRFLIRSRMLDAAELEAFGLASPTGAD